MDQCNQRYEFLKINIQKPLVVSKFSQREKRDLSLHAVEQRLFQRENGFVRTFV